MGAQPTKVKPITKRCPECFTNLPVDADRCTSCNQKVGKVTESGLAERPVDWMSYISAIIAVGAFCYFMWWLFIKK